MLNKSSLRKSREQKFYEFFEVLQLEYIVAELRYKIYPNGSRKEKSLVIMRAKKEKIFDIAIRNNLCTIFEDIKVGEVKLFSEELRQKLYGTVFPETGFPNFIYRDENHKRQLEPFDFKCYYQIGSLFNTIKGVGRLTEMDYLGETFTINIDGKSHKMYGKKIRRIL